MKPFIYLYCSLLLIFSCSKDKVEQSLKKENILVDKAYQYYTINRTDSAFIYFDNAKEAALQQKDSSIVNYCLIMMSMIASDKGDHFGAQEFALEALSYLNKKDTAQSATVQSCLHELGFISFNLKEYDQAIIFFKESLTYSKNNEGIIMTKNALANAYRDKKDYQKSMKIQQEMLKQKIDTVEYARILSNLTYTKWLNNPHYNAKDDLMEALTIRLKNNDRWGLNASFSHLADYYANKQIDSAFLFADKMYHNAISNKNPDDQLDALQKLVKLSPIHKTKYYFARYQKLNDSIQTSRNAAKNQFALVRYETEKHKAASIKKESDILKRNIALSVLVLILISGYFWYRRRKKILQQEKELEVKNTEIKYVKKVHDHVANRIYQVIDEIDNRPEMEKDEVADKLEVIYNITRDLSYEASSAKYQNDFAKSLEKMFSSYQSTKVNITVDGNDEKLWTDIQENIKSEVFVILQELMTNMSKHSQATEVHLQLKRNQKNINITYKDNGIGIQKDTPFGNGLKNTETRIQGISGNITFERNNGLQVNIKFPVA